MVYKIIHTIDLGVGERVQVPVHRYPGINVLVPPTPLINEYKKIKKAAR